MHSRSIQLWSLACRLPSGRETDTIILGRHGRNALNEYSLLVRHCPSMRKQSRVNLHLHGMTVHIFAGVSSRWALERIELVSAVRFLSLSCASETLRLISGFVP